MIGTRCHLGASRCLVLVIVTAAALSEHAARAQRNEASEMPEDCDQNLQYFHMGEARCRNCSDVMRLFEPGYQDWQQGAADNSEAVTIASTTTGANNNNNNNTNNNNNNNDTQTARQQHRNAIISSLLGSRLTPLPANRVASGRPAEHRNQQAPKDAMLSRLVLASPRDSIASSSSVSSNEDTPSDEPPWDEQQPPAPERYQEAEMSSGGGRRAVAGEEQAKQWHRFLTSFVGSRELAQVHLLEAIGQCRLEANSSACQLWSNMCVLTMYSHSDAPISSTSSASSSFSSSPGSARSITSSSSYGRNSRARFATSWQECPKFSLTSICNSLRDWHRNEKGPALSEVADIYYGAGSTGADAELLLPDGGGAARGPGGVPLVPFKLDQLIQLLAYEYALDGRLVRVSQFDLRDLSKFCLFSPSASLPPTGGESRNLGEQSPRKREEEENDRENPPPSGESGSDDDDDNNNNNNIGQDQLHEIRVGRSAGLLCRFSALQAAAFAPKHLNQTKFVDLFIGYQLNGATFIRPVPILLKNLLLIGSSASLPNLRHAQDPTRWKLVHRYFPLASVRLASDNINNNNSGKSGGIAYNYDNSDVTKTPLINKREQRVLVYARDAKLEIKFKSQGGSGGGLVISSMLLHLDYDHILLGGSGGRGTATRTKSQEKNQRNEIRIRVRQTQIDMPSHLKDLDLMLAIVCLASCIWSLIRCYNIQKYQGLIKLDIYSLGLFLIIACDIVANLVALLTGLFALYLFASSKLSPAGPWPQQWLPLMMAPAADEATQQNLLAKLKLALALKLAGLFYKLRIRLNVDLFFIDWERPKMLTSQQLLMSHHHHLHASGQATNKQQQQQQQQVADGFGKQQQFQHQQISFWRPYTIINRWLQMQTWRRQNVTLQLLTLVCCLQFISLDQLATSDGNLRLESAAEGKAAQANPLEPQLVADQCQIFRSLLLTLLYLFLACAQIAYKRLVHEPWLRCDVREFLDLCSVANVSLFAMLYPRYGFYLHGRNANGSGDCGLAEMNVMLEREERDLCSKRGLLPNSDHQTFTMVLPRIINDHYRKLLFRNELFLNQVAFTNNSLMMSTPLMMSGAGAQWRPRLPNAITQAGDSGQLTATTQQHKLGSPTSTLSRSSSSSIESVVARNKAINVFLVNFLDHIYKDIDYTIRERRRFESLLELELDLNSGGDDDDEDDRGAGGPAPRKVPLTTGSSSSGVMSMMMRGGGGGGATSAGRASAAASLFVDRGQSFASLLWLGLEWDLLLVELLVLLHLDLVLGKENLTLTIGLVWLGNKLFQRLYGFMARKNLVTKSMLDEKFLIRL